MIGCLLQCGTLALASRMIWLLWLLSLLLALLLALLFVVVVVWLLVLLLPSQKPRIIFAPMSEPLLLQLDSYWELPEDSHDSIGRSALFALRRWRQQRNEDILCHPRLGRADYRYCT